jgi:chemotaxis protein CheD
MGELVASRNPGDVLGAIGLGSCIGLALIDTRSGVAGLAHVMLPATPAGAAGTPAKFADTAVPALTDAVVRLGAVKTRLVAVLAGGAQMLGAAGVRLDVGARNDAAVRTALAGAGLRVGAAETGGTRGRTLRVHVGECWVTVKEAGGPLEYLWPRDAARERGRRWATG